MTTEPAVTTGVEVDERAAANGHHVFLDVLALVDDLDALPDTAFRDAVAETVAARTALRALAEKLDVYDADGQRLPQGLDRVRAQGGDGRG